jgi:hypothetical protein
MDLNLEPPVPDFKLKRSQGYLGNKEIKRAGVTLPLTPEHIKEYAKCAMDINYFCEMYMKIVSVDDGLIPLKPFPFQKKIIAASIENRFNIVVCARQSGKTTTNTAIILHYILFNEQKNVAIIANKAQTARSILDRIQLAYRHLPKWLQQGVVEWNKGSSSFENGCKIFVGSTTSSSIRGETIAMLFIDEVAFIEPNLYEEFFRSVYPTISSGKTTKIFMVSTPNGMNHFYTLVKAARENKSGFKLLEFTWRDVPGRTEEWKEQEIANTSPEAFNQEQECVFMGSTKTLLSSKCLKDLSFNNPLDINDEKTLKLYEKPIKRNPDIEDDVNNVDHQYFLSVDVSEGLNQDYSTISVIDITSIPYKQVATYRSNRISPLLFPMIIYKMATAYNNAYVLVENNSIGHSVVNDLNFDLGYENVLFIKTTEEEKIRLGMKTTVRTKKLGCLRIKDLLESGILELNDEQTILELYNFVEKGPTYAAEEGYQDDMVMGLVNFAYYSSLEQFRNLTENVFKVHFQEMKKKHLEDSMPTMPYMNMDAAKEVHYDPTDEENQKLFDQGFYL